MAKKVHTINIHRHGKIRTTDGTLEALTEYFGYTLEVGASWNKKINQKPKTIKTLVKNINLAKEAAAANGCPDTYYTLAE